MMVRDFAVHIFPLAICPSRQRTSRAAPENWPSASLEGIEWQELRTFLRHCEFGGVEAAVAVFDDVRLSFRDAHSERLYFGLRAGQSEHASHAGYGNMAYPTSSCILLGQGVEKLTCSNYAMDGNCLFEVSLGVADGLGALLRNIQSLDGPN